MPKRLVVVGAGGFGRETLDIVEASVIAGADIELVGVVASGAAATDLEQLAQRGVPFLGSEKEWLQAAEGSECFVVAIGDPTVRQAVSRRFAAAGLTPLSVIHPRSVVGSQSVVGQGVVIASGVQISTNVTVGNHVHLNPGSIIGHDAVLGDFVSVNPGSIVSGNVAIGTASLLGAGSIVLQGLEVGARAIVGAGACVTKDVESGQTVIGVPARAFDSTKTRSGI